MPAGTRRATRFHDLQGDRRAGVRAAVAPSGSTRACRSIRRTASTATHVAGIAAGNHGTQATPSPANCRLRGRADAYIGNYKALTIPTPSFGLDGNAPEIAKAIEQAVADGMDVINLSLGEPEIEPSRDIVVKAIDGAALAGVVPCIAAGNDGDARARARSARPASAPLAITAAASTTGRADIIAGFSSTGPAPFSLQLKPDVTAPGVTSSPRPRA